MKIVNKSLLYSMPVLVLVVLIGSYLYKRSVIEGNEDMAIETVDFSQYAAGPERKQAFVEYFKPLIEKENQAVLALREKIIQAQKKATKPRWLIATLADYRLTSFDETNTQHWKELLARVDKVPMSLALAQAANESGWGTSRFAREGNNFYGQWCFSQGCGIVPASRNAGANHEVAAFDSPRQSVSRYILNINSHPAYADLRAIRLGLRQQQQSISGVDLAAGLLAYSERKEAYIKELRDMIRHNRWARLDRPLE